MTILRPREIEALRHVAEGLTDKQIARVMGIEPKTVANHMQRAMHANGLPTRTALAVAAVRDGLL